AFNAALGIQGQGMWQHALPLYHVGGFQIVIRSIMGGTPFICYRTFNAERLLADATVYGTTHISVVDKMLQDLLAADRPQRLQCYECVLLGGATPNPATLERAAAAGARVYASYGMTETASLIAADFAGPDYQGATTLLPGYEAQIISPGKKGVGQLAVRGPGIFGGYLNTNAAFTVDGFFLTGDTASMRKQQIKVQERINDMFVSGGENIYPAEIQEKLEKIPGVSAAFVFGVDDEAWGKRPVALLERNAGGTDAADGDDAGAAAGVLDGSGALGVAEASEASGAGLQPPCSLQAFAAGVSTSLESRLAKIYRPHHICVMDAFPRTAAGKPDRVVLKGRYDERLEVHEVRLYRIRQQFKEPVTTAKATLRFRESVIVEVIDWAGRTGLAECVAFPTDFYLPETLDMDVQILEKHLIPLVLDQVYLHPREVSACFDECGPAAAYPMAKAALEPAFWDLYGKIVGKPLWELIGGCGGQDGAAAGNSGQDGHTGSSPDRHSPAKVPAGVVLGIMSVAKTLEAVAGAVGEGYSRVKLKIKPGDDLARVRAVRDAFADLTVTLDANQSYSERDFASLQALDELGIRGIEEPIDPGRLPKVGPTDLFARLSRLQKDLKTTVFLDESVATVAAFEKALFFPALRSHVLKIAKFGGVAPALDAYAHMCERGVEAWMGGMYDTGVSKYLHAAFETLPGITLAGDLSSSSRYFDSDICDPPFEVEGGWVVLNPSSHEAGLGCTLNYETLQKTLVDRRTFTRT
ncbi:MAG: AMP-binding protein, partial [Coriobacteriaceae bacterium]|nr:AMP-binding protein [Coriobacteriaceae bacterium]